MSALVIHFSKMVLKYQFSLSVVFDSLRPHGLQHTTLPCPSLPPGVGSNSCPLSPWCYLIISSSATCFSFCPQSFPVSGSFPMSQLFSSGSQSTELQLQHQSFDEYSRLKKRREAKGKGEKERYTHLNAEFQRIARRDEKAFLSNQCKEI